MQNKIRKLSIIFMIVCIVVFIVVLCDWIFDLPRFIEVIAYIAYYALAWYYFGYVNAYETYKYYIRMGDEDD